MSHSLDFRPPAACVLWGICTFPREKYTPPNRLLFVGTPPVAVGSSGSWPRLSFQRAPTTGGGFAVPRGAKEVSLDTGFFRKPLSPLPFPFQPPPEIPLRHSSR